MLFNTYIFLFAFLPVTLVGYFVLTARDSTRPASIAWLVLTSLFYYGYWEPKYLVLMGVSIVLNYVFGLLLGDESRPLLHRRAVLALGSGINLALLSYFKYAGFAVGTVNTLFGLELPVPHIVLPLAISFFTFQQMAYLVDAYQGQTREYRFTDYCLFVTFFPQLIAGPIVHHKEMLPQFEDRSTLRPRADNFAIGLTILIIGLFKKVVIADSIAVFANIVFDGAAAGHQPTFAEAWIGALAYTFQLYFDFSGYSDMAIGLARLFGIKLPINFNSPYKARNIADFWRRWHITLSRFLRDYLYIPLGGSRKGPSRRYVNLMITMVLGGLWHGAGWTFVAWGTLHGVYLCINHGFQAIRTKLGWKSQNDGPVMHLFSRSLTFLAVIIGWVFFRATSFDAAGKVLAGMFGGAGLSTRTGFDLPEAGAMVVVAWLVAWFAPNTQEFMDRYEPAMFPEKNPPPAPLALPLQRLRWRPSFVSACVCAIVGVISVLMMSRVTEFLYFQF
ncbi:MAG: MBOAT family protein [Leptolyngbya sp. PLA3]|nr:MAG: MBOAT family protein [Cyanobacteria bacterium CYA]MCE7969669.1 MBOAT family protein [Leptolyngbya sp. PL-A3]